MQPAISTAPLLAHLQAELGQRPPFAQMRAEHVLQFLAHAEPVCFASGEWLLAPEHGVASHLHDIRRGSGRGQSPCCRGTRAQ